MKTAIQQLIDDLTSEIEDRKSVPATNKMYHTSTRIVQEILDFYVKPLQEKEKEQIISAYNDGVNDGNTQGLQGKEGNGNYATLEEYYNQTYNQNK